MSEENISRMNFKELRNEVQSLRDELARMKRSYEDILYNLDYDNFSTSLIKKADNMQTSIEQSAEAIILQAQAIEGNTSAIGELSVTAETIKLSVTEVKGGVDANSAAIKLNAESISAEVRSREDADEELSTSITQTADSIKFAVNASYSNPVTIDGMPDKNSDKNKMYYDTQNECYWYYDGSDWCSTTNANFGTVFEQTTTGFRLKGDVTINGSTIISEKNDEGDTVQISNGYIYLMPEEAEKPKMTIGFNTSDDNSAPFIQFGQGASAPSSIAGIPTTPGTALLYKDANSFSIQLYTQDDKNPMMSFHDGGVSGIYNDGSFISFNSSVVDFTYASVNGLKITFG